MPAGPWPSTIGNSPTMRLSTSILAATFAGIVAADDTTSPELVTITNYITNNGRTYTRTATQRYTGQPTTRPTSGTVTDTLYRVDSDGSTFPFRTMTDTYGQATVVATSKIVTGPERTYTRPWSRTMHTTEVSAYLSSKDEFNSRIQAELDGDGVGEGHPYGGDDWDDSDDEETTSASNGAAKLGVGSAAMVVAAALLL